VNIQSKSNILELDKVSAFCKHAPVEIQASQKGLLNGLSYGVKDIYDIAGIPTGFGSPAWLNTHPIPSNTATFIKTLSKAGATLVGKTHTDELTYSILGINAHYGTPLNSAGPARVPGGSSSGSAAAVAAGLVDFSVGSDTGGSVRAPASFCGIYGIRTTHGRISLKHARALARSFDSFGWFARDPKILLQVGEALFNERAKNIQKTPKFFILKEAFDIIPEAICTMLKKKIATLFDETPEELSIAPDTLSNWAETFRIVQASEIWQEHGEWAMQHLHEFGPGIKERFEIAKSLDPKMIEQTLKEKTLIENKIRSLFIQHSNDHNEAVLLLPTTGCIAPLLNSSPIELEGVRKQLFQLLCIAGLGGLPQINLPVCKYEDAPLGLSLIANTNQDLLMLDIATQFQPSESHR